MERFFFICYPSKGHLEKRFLKWGRTTKHLKSPYLYDDNQTVSVWIVTELRKPAGYAMMTFSVGFEARCAAASLQSLHFKHTRTRKSDHLTSLRFYIECAELIHKQRRFNTANVLLSCFNANLFGTTALLQRFRNWNSRHATSAANTAGNILLSGIVMADSPFASCTGPR